MKRFFILCFIPTSVWAENSSSISSLKGDATSAPIHEQKSQAVPGDKVIPPIDNQNIDAALEKARNAWIEGQERLAARMKAEADTELQKEQKKEKKEKPVVISYAQKTEPTYWKPKTYKPIVIEKPTGQSITIFHHNLEQEEETITLPSGAHAFGRVKFGEEVTAQGEQEVLLEFDYAFLGPNESVVEMTGCITWLQVKANFHTQRVKGQMQDMTCTMKNGRVFTLPLSGPIVEVATGYAGVNSDLIMRGPSKVLALKFLSEITTAYGAATSAVETTTNVVAAGEGQTDRSTNVTGDKGRYVGGKIMEANGKFLDYIASFFMEMQPTLALAPGTKVHAINRYNVRIPKQFFKFSGSSK
ncbi:MAG: hypothetical protein H6618_08840 [Deltaproteobacteria bacterium]|nr:hypothetical protein [Deltaproteobacteria bacterium]